MDWLTGKNNRSVLARVSWRQWIGIHELFEIRSEAEGSSRAAVPNSFCPTDQRVEMWQINTMEFLVFSKHNNKCVSIVSHRWV